MSQSEYSEKLKAQIEQYRGVENIHELPDIFHYWSNKYIRPKINSIFDVDSVVDFYAKPFIRASENAAQPFRLLSIGAGDCSLEIKVAKKILEAGCLQFELTCLEVSPELIGRAVNDIREAQLGEFISIEEVDINGWKPTRKYFGIMANHSLHHFVELESIFASVHGCLQDGGVFVSNDMIGRNGHMRWPEVQEFVEGVWEFMPDRYKYNQQLKRLEPHFVNWDCSTEGFEGIRAQDILPLLSAKFGFESFFAFGGITDVFVDRAFGHNLDSESVVDRAFIDFLQLINDRLIDGNVIKPTTMFAVMTKDSASIPRVWRERTPEFCTRIVEA